MKKTFACFILTIAILTASCDPKREDEPVPEPTGPTFVTWKKPANFPDPVYDFSKNPLTEEGVELGRFLFYDGILSRTGNIGCGTCHQQASAFTHHGHDLSHGVDDRIGTRNSIAVQNMAWSTSFFWDGGVHDLDFLPLAPITNVVEMDETMANIILKLTATPAAGNSKAVNYPKMYKAAFGSEEITSEKTLKALSQFMLTMVSATSRYDYFKMGDASALNAQEKEGMVLFQQKCSACHAGELFTDFSFRNNGLIPSRIDDQGRFLVTLDPADKYKFKVPSLRNVGISAPYMHDGRYTALSEVLDHYSNDQNSSSMDIMLPNPTLDPLLMTDPQKPGIRMTATEKQAIIAFLRTLNDEQFVQDKRFSDPGIGTSN